MPMFTKKPVTIEARQMPLEPSPTDAMAIAEWMVANGYPWLLGNALEPETLVPETEPAIEGSGIWIDPGTGMLIIRTLEGDMSISLGDWVIKGVQGEFYPCKPDIFEATYDEERKPQGPVETMAYWARQVLDNDGALTADSSMSLDMAHDELTAAAKEYLGSQADTDAARMEVKAAVEEWFSNVDLDDLFKVKGWPTGPAQCKAEASWGSNRLTHTHQCTKSEHHARDRHECECGASWLTTKAVEA